MEFYQTLLDEGNTIVEKYLVEEKVDDEKIIFYGFLTIMVDCFEKIVFFWKKKLYFFVLPKC